MAPSKADANKNNEANVGKAAKFPKWSLSDNNDFKVDKWDGSAVKNALDDAVRKIFTDKFHYTENHRLIDGRLAICVLAVGVAILALACDHLYPFPQSRPMLIISVISYFFKYFVLMAYLTVYTTYTEKGVFLVAVKKESSSSSSKHGASSPADIEHTWHVSSDMKRFDDIYHLDMSYSVRGGDGDGGGAGSNKKGDDSSGSTIYRETNLSKSVCNWFDENGLLLFATFEEDVSRLHNSLLADKKDK